MEGMQKVRKLTPQEKMRMLREGFSFWDIMTYEYDLVKKETVKKEAV
jgi:hypothetical protein